MGVSESGKRSRRGRVIEEPTRKNDEQLKLFEDVDLGDVEEGEHHDGWAIRLGEVREVNSVVRSVDHPATSVCKHKQR